jgi:hypothetical protein
MVIQKVKKQLTVATDIRPYIADLQFSTGGRGPGLRLRLHCSQEKGSVKATDVLSWYYGTGVPPELTIVRTGMFIVRDNNIFTPMEVL